MADAAGGGRLGRSQYRTAEGGHSGCRWNDHSHFEGVKDGAGRSKSNPTWLSLMKEESRFLVSSTICRKPSSSIKRAAQLTSKSRRC